MRASSACMDQLLLTSRSRHRTCQGLSLYHYLYVQAPSAMQYCARKHGFEVLAKCIVKCAFYIDAEPSFLPIRARLPLLPQGRVWDLRHAIPAMRPARHWVRKL